MLFNHPCKIPILLAYCMLTYCFACTYYLIVTRSYGTPFRDSLTPEQAVIKRASVLKRKKAFINGILIGLILLVVFKPFLNK
ncbi:hypothetical protein CPAV1605_490 [seawater metagenome]|uniref:Uncharacterized protein n=1 Tax=seawater metagenome TaxID=1561972 RepID=A0A5E8CLC1_9ZZZZ